MPGDNRPDASELSDRQREVLDRVAKRKTSKEIARDLGISKATVDQRILLARQKLGAANRNELVMLYLASRSIYDQTLYDPAQLPPAPPTDQTSAQDERSGPVYSVADIAGYIPAYVPGGFPPLPRPLEMLDRNFGVMGRLGAIGLVAALLAISLLAMITMSQTLSALF